MLRAVAVFVVAVGAEPARPDPKSPDRFARDKYGGFFEVVESIPGKTMRDPHRVRIVLRESLPPGGRCSNT
jgi:hypothetical protein